MSLNQAAGVERIILGAGIPDYSASLGDYFTLLKPRVMSLVVLTALAGLLVAPVHVIRSSASPRFSPSRSAPAHPSHSTCGGTPTLTC